MHSLCGCREHRSLPRAQHWRFEFFACELARESRNEIGSFDRGVTVRFPVSLLFVVALGACQTDGSDPDAPPCERLREHLIDLRLDRSSTSNQDEYREVMRRALGADFMQSCARLSSAQLRCALESSSLNESARCSEASK